VPRVEILRRRAMIQTMKLIWMQLVVVGLALASAATVSMSAETQRQPAPGAAGAKPIAHVDPAGAEKLMAERQVVVLDIRTPKEFAAGHIRGAINLDFYAADFEQQLARLDKDKSYLLHCASGNRSTRSLPQFNKLQFKSVVHLDGGMKAWQSAGKPVSR
jgi:phage shock protein E